MKTIIASVLCLATMTAYAGETVSLQSMNGTSISYPAYQAPSIRSQDLGALNSVFRNCWKVTTQEFSQREGLAVDENIVGAFYCDHLGARQANAVVRQFK